MQRLTDADSVAEVIAIAKRYVNGWSFAERARLPENCRPCNIENAEDVTWWADTFGTEHASGELISPELQDMFEVFQCAVEKIREIARGRESVLG
jgi:hypothetical protein